MRLNSSGTQLTIIVKRILNNIHAPRAVWTAWLNSSLAAVPEDAILERRLALNGERSGR